MQAGRRYTSRRRGWANVLRWSAIAVATLWLLFPFYWTVTTSLKSGLDLYRGYVPFVNYTPTLGMWKGELATRWELDRMALLNSLAIASGSAVISVMLGGSAAYGLAGLRGRRFTPWLTILCLGPRFIYPIALLIPFYLMMRLLGLVDNVLSMIIANSIFGLPFAVLILRDAFVSIPRELEEAALVDGASRPQALVRVVLPLAAPGLVASAIFAFTLSWNEFLYALVFIQDETTITVPVGLNLLIYGDVFHWGQLMAASVITTLPVVALYVFIHRWMVEGLVAGSVKG